MCVLLAFIGLILSEVINVWWSLLLIFPTCFLLYFVSFTLSIKVLKRLARTTFLRARILIVLTSLGLIGLAFSGDAKIVVLLLFIVVQLAAFTGDALVQSARPLRCVLGHSCKYAYMYS